MQKKVETIKEAVNVLIQAAEMAQSKGIFNLADARLVADAIDILTNKPETVKEEIHQPVNDENKINENVHKIKEIEL